MGQETQTLSPVSTPESSASSYDLIRGIIQSYDRARYLLAQVTGAANHIILLQTQGNKYTTELGNPDFKDREIDFLARFSSADKIPTLKESAEFIDLLANRILVSTLAGGEYIIGYHEERYRNALAQWSQELSGIDRNDTGSLKTLRPGSLIVIYNFFAAYLLGKGDLKGAQEYFSRAKDIRIRFGGGNHVLLESLFGEVAVGFIQGNPINTKEINAIQEVAHKMYDGFYSKTNDTEGAPLAYEDLTQRSMLGESAFYKSELIALMGYFSTLGDTPDNGELATNVDKFQLLRRRFYDSFTFPDKVEPSVQDPMRMVRIGGTCDPQDRLFLVVLEARIAQIPESVLGNNPLRNLDFWSVLDTLDFRYDRSLAFMLDGPGNMHIPTAMLQAIIMRGQLLGGNNADGEYEGMFRRLAQVLTYHRFPPKRTNKNGKSLSDNTRNVLGAFPALRQVNSVIDLYTRTLPADTLSFGWQLSQYIDDTNTERVNIFLSVLESILGGAKWELTYRGRSIYDNTGGTFPDQYYRLGDSDFSLSVEHVLSADLINIFSSDELSLLLREIGPSITQDLLESEAKKVTGLVLRVEELEIIVAKQSNSSQRQRITQQSLMIQQLETANQQLRALLEQQRETHQQALRLRGETFTGEDGTSSIQLGRKIRAVDQRVNSLIHFLSIPRPDERGDRHEAINDVLITLRSIAQLIAQNN